MSIPQPTAVPALRPGYRMQWEPVQNCHVLLYPEGMVKLNESAAEALKRVDGQRSINEIIAELQACFPSAPELDEDVLAFMGEAHEQRWILFR
ncbi:pyrroloquinoline quinone biosynthesis peptide chaperone PqqD [Pseudomonas sp. G11-1]|uniref:pyrroloquinoline quinone biosynthesis peptide chaperone PqqD n=1 Tax=Halopseudomonas sp. SMJS2 TaxID=3041098 RepID=UPI002453370F|nr:pyrroloquinoline quinone biosynthesis peptide chaperone PqqD [Halopseudomonas sp. SMJS2]MCO5787677.1 pyrroloquinoline quinone biosynthesis peptide chaperone PqqD [Pseudomonas sp. G11-1]MCO5790903.1 pyrroloquinoline quinone biosynthesis peptide chaperone PqqD [Pseudomonas sp. G11-2]WGK63150.1 pyrroloquinoline quinone biosynthesis peptide chaperone PqqD [Halopseudomonas sp. SMJS2]